MGLARAPRRAARKKGSGYENERVVAEKSLGLIRLMKIYRGENTEIIYPKKCLRPRNGMLRRTCDLLPINTPVDIY
jgi:hypothetical protein